MSVVRSYQDEYCVLFPPTILLKPRLGVFALMRGLRSEQTRHAFDELCSVSIAAARQWEILQGACGSIRPTANELGFLMPPDTNDRLTRAEEHFLWSKESQRAKSVHPIYAFANST
jgi:hypothetical protein